MKTLFSSFLNLCDSCARGAFAGALLAGISLSIASGGLEHPGDFTVAVSGSDIKIRFGTVVGQTYAVEKSTTLEQGNWAEILGNVAGTGAVQTTTDIGAGTLSKCFYRIRYGGAPMALIPAGSFQMGDVVDGNSDPVGAPLHMVYVSAFYMEKYFVTKAQWDVVSTWAVGHGYAFDNAGSGKAPDHPVQAMNWWDRVKWCNARSEKEGLTPCYTLGGATYKTGQSSPDCNLSASGYRLPTEAEWEKAARGGLSGKRFPWGDAIDRSRANYTVVSSDGTTNSYSYDLGTPIGNDPTYNDGVVPYTSPVGSYPANGYGLYDMAGNVQTWCNDWLVTLGSGAASDPTGPTTGTYRVIRGGHWSNTGARTCRVAYRNGAGPTSTSNLFGLRCVRRLAL